MNKEKNQQRIRENTAKTPTIKYLQKHCEKRYIILETLGKNKTKNKAKKQQGMRENTVKKTPANQYF